MAKIKRIKPINTIPIGSVPVDIETFIAGIDSNLANGEYDEMLEQELAPTEVENIRKVDTLYDILIDTFYKAAQGWEAKKQGSKFHLSVQPQAFNEGDFIAIITMRLHYNSVNTGPQLVCEKKIGIITLEQLSQDFWKVALVKEMITELFGMTSVFIDAKKSIKSTDLIKAKLRAGETKRKDK